MRTARLTLVALTATSAVGCTAMRAPSPVVATPSHVPTVRTAATNGTIYRSAELPAPGSVLLFDDLKAWRVGDTLTIRLAESTQASKSASTSAKKDTKLDTGTPTLLGGAVGLTKGGNPLLNNTAETSQEFGGNGSSSQSNSLNGNVTVTVTDILPNGNLVVRGEKWLTLNQGEEFIEVFGVVRQADIGTDNSVPSFKLADARITYSGKGTLADSNRPGLLARIFMKFWPL